MHDFCHLWGTFSIFLAFIPSVGSFFRILCKRNLSWVVTVIPTASRVPLSPIFTVEMHNVEVVGGGSVMQYTVQFISRPVAKQVL